MQLRFVDACALGVSPSHPNTYIKQLCRRWPTCPPSRPLSWVISMPALFKLVEVRYRRAPRLALVLIRSGGRIVRDRAALDIAQLDWECTAGEHTPNHWQW